jgi:hypothetical protein
MSASPCKHEGDTVLLVEGVNDCHVILALCVKFELPTTFGIYECGNDDMAIRRLNALISSPRPPRVIGLVIDADDPDLAGRWDRIREKLAHYTYKFPQSPAPEGTIVEPVNENSRLGFWLMPNNRKAGMLEDFCSEMIDDSCLIGIKECVEIAKVKEITTFKDSHYSKAVVHTYLALQDEPGKPLGQSITANTLRADTSTTRAFVAWLNRLFGSA